MEGGFLANYLRISDDDADIGNGGKRESDSIGNQRSMIQYFIGQNAELQKYPVREFCDDGYSGVTFKRPGIQELLKEVRENKIACIIVKDFSRLGRNYIEVGDYLEQIFPFLGIRFISIADNYDSLKSTGGIEVGFKTLIHDLYSRDLSGKVKSVKRMHQERGRHSGGGVPFGYIETPGNHTCYQIDSEAARIVSMMFELAAEGNTTGMIAKQLNEKEVGTPGLYRKKQGMVNYKLSNEKGQLWSPEQVKEVLQNETYKGTYLCHKLTTSHVREIRKTASEEYKRFEHAHEAIVSVPVFEKAQAVIHIRGKRGSYQTEGSNYILKGKAKCGFCGYSLNRISRAREPYYICRMGKSCGSGVRIDSKTLDGVVLNSMKQLAAAFCEQGKSIEENGKQVFAILANVKEEKRILEMKLERCKNDKFSCYREYKEGRLTKEAFQQKQQTMAEQVKSNTENLESINSRLEQLALGYPEGCKISPLNSNAKQIELTRPLVEDIMERIDIYGTDRVEIKWKFREEFES